MMRFTRPDEPAGFREIVREARANIETALGRGRRLSDEDFPNLWSRYKAVLARAQHGKCGYCERDITSHAGDVEHYRPKAGLEELPTDPTNWGQEDPYTGNIAAPRRPARLCDQGYPWLAYEWNNYLVACESCNRKWKRCLFPVAEAPRSIPPVRGGVETPLLLDPFGDVEPSEHLEFTAFGTVAPRNGSLIGRATIETCALDRPSLVRSRAPIAADVGELLFDLLEAGSYPAQKRILDRLREKGDDARPHAGMVRSIVTETVPGLPWSDLVSID